MLYNKQTLAKLERKLSSVAYRLRYGRGSFEAGYCMVNGRRVVVLSRLLSLEGRIDALSVILEELSGDRGVPATRRV